MIKLINPPIELIISFGIQPLGFSLTHLSIIPVWDKGKGINTPTA